MQLIGWDQNHGLEFRNRCLGDSRLGVLEGALQFWVVGCGGSHAKGKEVPLATELGVLAPWTDVECLVLVAMVRHE